MTISAFRRNICGLSKYLNGQQGQTSKSLGAHTIRKIPYIPTFRWFYFLQIMVKKNVHQTWQPKKLLINVRLYKIDPTSEK